MNCTKFEFSHCGDINICDLAMNTNHYYEKQIIPADGIRTNVDLNVDHDEDKNSDERNRSSQDNVEDDKNNHKIDNKNKKCDNYDDYDEKKASLEAHEMFLNYKKRLRSEHNKSPVIGSKYLNVVFNQNCLYMINFFTLLTLYVSIIFKLARNYVDKHLKYNFNFVY